MKLLSIAPQEIVANHCLDDSSPYEFYLDELEQHGGHRLPVPVMQHENELWAIDKNHLTFFARAANVPKIRAMVMETLKDFEFLRDENHVLMNVSDEFINSQEDERIKNALKQFRGRVVYSYEYDHDTAYKFWNTVVAALMREGFPELDAKRIFYNLSEQFSGRERSKFYTGNYIAVGNPNWQRGSQLLREQERGYDWTKQFGGDVSEKGGSWPIEKITEFCQENGVDLDPENLKYTGLSDQNLALLNTPSIEASVLTTRAEVAEIWNSLI